MEANGRNVRRYAAKAVFGVFAAAVVAAPVIAGHFGQWGTPVSAQQGSDPALNTEFVDGCPIMTNDGLGLYFASTRPGGLGGIDIWMATRATTTSGWGAPVNVGAPINSAADDFCPTPIYKRLFFVSKRDDPAGDIYVSTRTNRGWQQPTHLGPNVNSTSEEWSPSVYTDSSGNEVLYFSSTRPGGKGGQDIYSSVNYGPAQPVTELNTEFDDARPNVSRNGREMVFDSTRQGTLGGPDIWTAYRSGNTGSWRPPLHLTELSSAAPDTRASLSFDRTFMLFGSARTGGEGLTDIYVTHRPRN